MLKVGDKVSWRGAWGTEDVIDVYVRGLSVTELPRSKYGDHVSSVPWELIKQNRVVVSLSTGNWAYANQIAPLGKDPSRWH